MAHKRIWLDNDEVCELYVNRHFTLQQLAQHFGVCIRTIEAHFRTYGIKKRTRSETQLLDLNNRRQHELDAKELYRLYVDLGMTGTEIAAMHNVTPAVITTLFNRFDIPVRTRSEQRALTRDTNVEHRHNSFVERCRVVHNDSYLYDRVSYVNSHTRVNVHCPKHGLFSILPYKHQQGVGCAKCAIVPYSRMCASWLNAIQQQTGTTIRHALNGGEFRIPSTRYRADGYCAETNTVYEFLGDIWHGNLKMFAPSTKCNPHKSLTTQQLYDNTWRRLKEINQLGFAVAFVWEQDWTAFQRSGMNGAVPCFWLMENTDHG